MPDNGESFCRITYIEVNDVEKGGYSVLVSGGVDFHYVDLYVESADGEGFEFNILIYGYKINY